MSERRPEGANGWLSGILGALLMLLGVGLGAMTEQSAITSRMAFNRHGGEVLDLADAQGPQAGQHGYMVRVAGDIDVVEQPYDADFGQRINTPVLVRHVEMFQWREVRMGSDVHYEQDWVDRPVDAAGFARPAGHANPGAFPITGKQFDASLVKVGGFVLSPPLLHELPGSDFITPSASKLPENLAASFSQNGKYLTTSANTSHPRLGDLRISWEVVPIQQVTVFARLDGDRLVPAADADDGKGFDVQLGDRRLVDVLPDVPEPPSMVAVRRVLAVLLAAFGALLLLWRRLPSDRALPVALGAGLLLTGAVAGVMWLGKDLQAAAFWFLAAVVGLAVAVWRLHGAMERR